MNASKAMIYGFLLINTFTCQTIDDKNAIIRRAQKAFKCQTNGYFADINEKCLLFHVCHQNPNAKARYRLFTFQCSPGTVFNQMSQTCSREEDLFVSCEESTKLFYLNERRGDPSALYLTDKDLKNESKGADKAFGVISDDKGLPILDD